MKKLSICVLCFGDYPHLARRCLTSIAGSLRTGYQYVQDVRIAMNHCVDETKDFVEQWSKDACNEYDFPVHLYYTSENQCKYPLMRKMFYVPMPSIRPLPEWVMWFDDDSYFGSAAAGETSYDWWENLWNHAETADMLGQKWLMPVQGNQLNWIMAQSWFNAKVGPPKMTRGNKRAFQFCQGAWWVIRSEVLKGLNWPHPEIHHNGGDSMLGEALRHVGARVVNCYGGVHINADERGEHSKSKRRGRSENRVGWDYDGGQPDLSHHDFDFDVQTITKQMYPKTPFIMNLLD